MKFGQRWPVDEMQDGHVILLQLLSYKETAQAHFQLGLLYYLSKDQIKGKANFDAAVKMNPQFEENRKGALEYLKQNGLVK